MRSYQVHEVRDTIERRLHQYRRQLSLLRSEKDRLESNNNNTGAGNTTATEPRRLNMNSVSGSVRRRLRSLRGLKQTMRRRTKPSNDPVATELQLHRVSAELQHMQEEYNAYVLESQRHLSRLKQFQESQEQHEQQGTETKSQPHENRIQTLIEVGLFEPEEVQRVNNTETDMYCDYCMCYRVIDYETEMYICVNCMRSTPYIEHDKKDLPYGERMQFTKNIAYERINHFRKWLTNIQGLERTIIPNEVIDNVRDAIYSNSFKRDDDTDITYSTVHYYLKKLGYSSHYQNIWQIIHTLTGRSLLYFTPRQITILITRFYKVQGPFERHKGKRVNNLYSGYLLRRFCQQEHWNEYLRYIPRLTTTECRKTHDVCYRAMCDDLIKEDPNTNWEFPEN